MDQFLSELEPGTRKHINSEVQSPCVDMQGKNRVGVDRGVRTNRIGGTLVFLFPWQLS